MEHPTIELLTDGITSPFWEWFCEHAKREWGPSGRAFLQAVNDASEKPECQIELQKVLHTQKAVWALLSHPKDKLDAMREHAKQALQRELTGGASRRGPGL